MKKYIALLHIMSSFLKSFRSIFHIGLLKSNPFMHMWIWSYTHVRAYSLSLYHLTCSLTHSPTHSSLTLTHPLITRKLIAHTYPLLKLTHSLIICLYSLTHTIHSHIPTHTHSNSHTHTLTLRHCHTYIHSYINTHIHTHTHAHTYTYAHMYIHTCHHFYCISVVIISM